MTNNNQLDITPMLHAIIDLELAVDDAQKLLLGPDARLQTIYVQLDLQLSDFAQTAGWADVLHPDYQADRDQLLTVYVRTLALFLLLSAKRQWTHLVVLDDQQWQRVATADKKTKLADLNREYLAVKNFLNSAYFTRRQEDFRHAWHLWLKVGQVDFGFTTEEISTAYHTLMATAKQEYTE